MTRNPNLILRRDRGAALVVVLVVLMALVVIATPFAASMRLQEHSARNQQAQIEVENLGRSLRNEAIRQLNNVTSRAKDPTPLWDSRSEWASIVPDAAAMGYTEAADPKGNTISSLTDPRGYVGSVEITDEQGKINLNSCTALALGNLLASGLLEEPLADDADEIVLDDASRFYSDGKPGTLDGYVWVNGELIGYRHVAGNRLTGCERGVRGDNIEFTEPRSHGRYSSVIDARAYFVVRHRIDPELAAEEGAPRYRLLQSIADMRAIIEQISARSWTACAASRTRSSSGCVPT